MPAHESSQSPARRPQVIDRPSSSQSVSKGSPTAGHLSKSHKGSSTRLHKPHAVGHSRHPHGRVPSHGKGLNKLSKLGPGNPAEDVGNAKQHTRSASHTPSTSPVTSDFKRNGSNTSLTRSGSRVSMKRNASHGSTTKLGNPAKSQKAQIKMNLNKKGTDDAPIRGTANFEIGDEEQDEEWTEDSSSMSPATTRNGSRPKTPIPRDPPSPDGPSERASQNLPHSPPESLSSNDTEPRLDSAKVRGQNKDDAQHSVPSYSHPPDAEAVIHRLLNRSGHYAAIPKTSNIFASITPPVKVGSPGLGSTLVNEQSMPADGISHFLPNTASNSGSATPNSISHLQSNLHLDRPHHRPLTPTDPPPKSTSRRVKSAANLTQPRENYSPPTPKSTKPQPSPFESARGADPSAGISLTQLKLDLQRRSTQRDTPSSTHPLLNQGAMLNMTGALSATDMAGRLRRQYSEAARDVDGGRKYYPDLIMRKLPDRRAQEHGLSGRDSGRGRGTPKLGVSASSVGAGSVGSDDGKAQGRGRVRFDVGGRSVEDLASERASEDREEGVEGLLRRMWLAPGAREEELGE